MGPRVVKVTDARLDDSHGRLDPEGGMGDFRLIAEGGQVIQASWAPGAVAPVNQSCQRVGNPSWAAGAG